MTPLKNKVVLLILIIAALIFLTKLGSNNNSTNETGKKITITPAKTSENSSVRTYSGVLPCDDCDGIETTLTLTVNEELEGGTYKLIEKYLGRGNAAIEYTGDWTASEGLTEDPSAEIIVIDPDDPETLRGFLILGNEQLEALDKRGNRYESASDYRLNLQ